MTDTLLVSTRKGLFVMARENGAWGIEHAAFLGDNVTLALHDARDGNWYAALNLGHFGVKLHRSIDRGRSWSDCAVPAYAEGDKVATGDGKPPRDAALQLIWALEAGGTDQSGRLWAGTVPGGLFRSDDHGQSWQLLRSLWDMPQRSKWFGGGMDDPGIHSICIDPRDPRRILVGVSCAGVWRSDDDGLSWTQTAQGMRAAYMPPERANDPDIQDVHRLVQCRRAPESFWAQHHNGVFRSTAGGGDWREITDIKPSVFGFAVAVHPEDPDLAWFVPAIKDEKRIPVDGKLVVTRTRDGGKTFVTLADGLPQSASYDLVLRHALAIDDSGDQLAFASTTGGLWSTDDQGDSWQMLDVRLPPVHAVTFAA